MMNNKMLYWKLYQAKKRQVRALNEGKKEQTIFFPTFFKKSVDIRKKK